MHPGLLVLGGFLLGTAGVKALKSKPAHKVAVRATVCGLQMRDGVDRMLDGTKAECEDILAEAKYLRATEAAKGEEEVIEEVVIEEEVTAAKPKANPKANPKATPSRSSKKRASK